MDEFRRDYFIQVGLNVLCLLGVIALGIFVLILASRNTNALCALRHNSERQIGLTQGILDRHPNRAVIFGIPKPVYEASIANQQRTVNALSDLNC
jgi:hypothetical protein